MQFTNPACLDNDRKLALFLLDDVLEFCEEAGAAYVPLLVPVLCASLSDPLPACTLCRGAWSPPLLLVQCVSLCVRAWPLLQQRHLI